MSKERTSLSLDSDVAEYLRQDHVNASGLVNALVEKHMNGGASEDAIREFRIRQVESELNEIQSRAERKQEELETLREINEEQRNVKQAVLEDAREALAGTPREPDNPAIQHWAEEAGVAPSQLIDELERDEE